MRLTPQEGGVAANRPEFPDNFCLLILIYEPLTSKLNRLM